MPYKPTGNPPGRPRKAASVYDEPVEVQPEATTEPQRLSRAHEGFKRVTVDPSAGLHRPPRFGQKRREVGKRPILHPNVIMKAT